MLQAVNKGQVTSVEHKTCGETAHIHVCMRTKKQARAELQNQQTEAELTATPCLLPLEPDLRAGSTVNMIFWDRNYTFKLDP